MDSALVLAISEQDVIGEAKVYTRKGIVFQVQGDYEMALKMQLAALRLIE